MKLTFAAKTMPASEGTVSRHIHSHVKQKEGFFSCGFFGLFNSLWTSLSNWIL